MPSRRSSVVARSSSWPTLLVAVLAAAVQVAVVSTSSAQGPINEVNSGFERVRNSLRSDLIVVPLLADFAPPPASVSDRRLAALTTTSMAGWRAAEAWATGAPQQALLDGVRQVTQEQDVRRSFVFAQPYGQEALVQQDGGIELLAAELYSEIPGDPPLLAATRFHLLEKFDQMVCLMHVEATRLASEGDPDAAADVLADGILFARQIVDRAFAAEAGWGYDAISELQHRIRDIYYQDFRSGDPRANSARVIDLIERLDEREGYLEMGRARFPEGDLIAAEQLIALVMEERGGPREGVFGTVLASLGAVDRPLRLFSETARWRDAAERHANWFTTTDTLKAIGDDYRFRWSREWSDPVQRPPTTYATLQSEADRFAALFIAVPEIEGLYLARLRAITESAGTRHSLAAMAFTNDTGSLPISLAATRPRYIPRVDPDPLNSVPLAGRPPSIEFFVPIRDTARGRGERDNPEPHEVVIINPEGGDVAFRMRDDEFIVYSVGVDSQKNWAEEVQNTTNAQPGRDYLFWPPVLTVLRRDMMDSGRLR